MIVANKEETCDSKVARRGAAPVCLYAVRFVKKSSVISTSGAKYFPSCPLSGHSVG